MTNVSDFQSFYPYILVYMIIYMPTLALVNSVAFYQMRDTAKDFSSIRVFGSIGWIIACLLYTSPSPRDRTRSRMPSSA